VDQVLAELGAEEKPVLYVFSKIDAVADAELFAMRDRVKDLVPKSVFVSSVSDAGLEPLRRALLAAAREGTRVAEIRFSSSDGRLLAQVHREGDVLEQRTEDGQLILSARIPEGLASRLRKSGATVH
jgi:GTP-binding protein HflX